MKTASIHGPVLWPVHVPALLLGISAQALLVLLPLYVVEVGGSLAAASAAVACRGLGMMAFDIPAGMLAARLGDKAVMMLALVLIGCAQLAYLLTDNVVAICLIAFINGAGASSFLLGRMSYVTATCTPAIRGRVIAMLAGSLRASALLGPALGAIIVAYAGYATAFYVAAGATLVAFIAIGLFAIHERPATRELTVAKLLSLSRDYRGVFATAGVAAVAFMLLRSARTVLLPLIGADLGLDVSAIGFIVSASATIDVLLFYPAGLAMDRYGRRATAVPSSALLTLSIAAMAFATSFHSLLAAAIFAGAANGLSTGIVMTLGTDLAPRERRSEFLGIWRLLTDLGTAAGPGVISAVAVGAPIAAASLVVAGVGALGSFIVYRYVPETLVK